MDEGAVLLIVGAVLAASILVGLGASRAGVPALVAFLVLGMLLGSDGPGGIEFDDAELARHVGIIGLAAILYEGGLSTSWRRMRHVAVPAALLGTIGVAITAFLTGLAARLLFDLSWAESILLGSVVASTDAAAVFATLRFSHVRRRLARTLEGETGGNDPVAIALTIGLIEWIHDPTFRADDLALLIVRQLGLGLAVGVALGFVATRVFSRLPTSVGSFAPVASVAAAAIAFGAADVIGGSGFLAVYLVGLAVGSTPSRYRGQLVAFHEGLAFLAQVTMFVVLGLLVFPSDLPPVILPGLALAAILALFVRPVAVWASTSLTHLTGREQVFLGWAGLRGAVPIVLGTFVLSENVEHGKTIFNAVFFVVLVSALVQGTTLEAVANRLGLLDARPPSVPRPIEVDAAGELDLVEFDVSADYAIAGAAVRELGLPRSALVAVITRGTETIPPRGSTVIESGDRLYVLVPRPSRADLEDVFLRWRRRI
ncbi:MAG: potassium/proton antiporter [Gaiella sp.]